ncbi:MAG: PQQ-dependent sugar dehydrogenase [Thermomicrobiales bacterium]
MTDKQFAPLTRRAVLRLAAIWLPLAALAACGGGAASTATPTAATAAAPSTAASTAPSAAASGGATATRASGAASPATMPATSASAAAPRPSSTPATSGTPRPSTAASPAVAASPTSAAQPDLVKFRVEEVATGLDTPWEMAFAPDGRIFVTERPGRLRVIENGKLRAEPVATVPDVTETGEGGLLGMVLAPDFATSGNLYFYHTYNNSGIKNRVVRYTLTDRAAARGLGAQQIIFDNIPGASTHDGGRLAVGPDGKLYFTCGDAANRDLAQDRNALAGKIHRLELDGAIPADNPFPGSSVYTYGHRNPEGLAWQPGTNQLYATEHGNSANDEVNRIVAGSNYGWPEIQGTQTGAGMVTPIVTSGASTTWAPSGATFVRADTFPQLRGSLLFAGLRGATLWKLDIDTRQLTPLLGDQYGNGYGRLRAVREGPDGNLYVLTSNQDGRGSPTATDDRLLRLVPDR